MVGVRPAVLHISALSCKKRMAFGCRPTAPPTRQQTTAQDPQNEYERTKQSTKPITQPPHAPFLLG